MNSIADLYTLEILVNGSLYEVAPTDLDLLLSDSIYSIYPRATITLKDTTGLFLESRLTTLGLEYIFKVGFNNVNTELPFIINSFETPSQNYKQYLNGVIELDLIHRFFVKFKQEYISYNLVPSEIISDIIKNEKFTTKYIEKTASIQDDPYYNPGLSFKDFVNTIIYPNSYSVENSSDPFLCFIDANNAFHFETYSHMLSRKASRTLYLKPDMDILATDKIMEFLPFSLKYEKIRELLNQDYFILKENENPSWENETISLTDNRKSPLLITDKHGFPAFTKKVVGGFGTQKKDYKSKIDMNNRKKGNNLIDRIYCTVLLDTSLCAGKVVNLDVEFEQQNVSASYSGDYLIEATQHSWDSETLKGYTRMILSKQESEFPVGSTLTGTLIT